MSPEDDAQNLAERTAKDGKKPEGFTAEEQAAMKERAQEIKRKARRRTSANKEEDEAAVLAKIAEMPDAERAMALRIHALIKAE